MEIIGIIIVIILSILIFPALIVVGGCAGVGYVIGGEIGMFIGAIIGIFLIPSAYMHATKK